MPRSSSRQGPARKPRPDVFTVLLALALVALITACVFVYFDIARYEAGVSPFGPTHSAVNTVVAAATPICPSEIGVETLATRLT